MDTTQTADETLLKRLMIGSLLYLKADPKLRFCLQQYLNSEAEKGNHTDTDNLMDALSLRTTEAKRDDHSRLMYEIFGNDFYLLDWTALYIYTVGDLLYREQVLRETMAVIKLGHFESCIQGWTLPNYLHGRRVPGADLSESTCCCQILIDEFVRIKFAILIVRGKKLNENL